MARKGSNKTGNQQNVRHANRQKQQEAKGVGRIKNRHDSRTQAGNEQIVREQAATREDYNLSWFKPTEAQKEIIHSMCVNDLTAVQGSSGCGKSTTTIWQALNEMKRGNFKHIVFIKTPCEDGSDQIGFLSGSENDKLAAHMEAMRSIFHDFMSKEKLIMEEKRGRIKFTIPNFIAGKTISNSIMIIDEAHKINETTTKLLLERAGEGTIVVLLGDKRQRYAAKRRGDGFTDFVNMFTEVDEVGERYSFEDTMGYVYLPASENMRSALSKKVVSMYEEREEH